MNLSDDVHPFNYLAERSEPLPDATQTDGARRALMVKELAQGRPTLVRTDLSAASEAEKTRHRASCPQRS